MSETESLSAFTRLARAGANVDTYVNALQHYANTQNWVLVHAVPTRDGDQVPGCVTTFCMTRVSYTHAPVIVRTVRLRLDARGFSVQRRRWVTNA